MNRANQERSGTEMVTVDCPWCAEPAMVEAAEVDELVCEACGVRADLAPDPVSRPIVRAA
ncbi:MAG TPA: hypothetical protein VF494_07645 [Candidatus Limnocylindrales bacterium]